MATRYDVLIIGGGIAGVRAATEAKISRSVLYANAVGCSDESDHREGHGRHHWMASCRTFKAERPVFPMFRGVDPK